MKQNIFPHYKLLKKAHLRVIPHSALLTFCLDYTSMLNRNWNFISYWIDVFSLGSCPVVFLKVMGEKCLLELVVLIEAVKGNGRMSQTSLKMLPLYFKWKFNILNSSKCLKSWDNANGSNVTLQGSMFLHWKTGLHFLCKCQHFSGHFYFPPL